MGSEAKKLIVHWWRHEDQYGWVSSYLASRNLRKFTQVMVAIIIAAFGVIPVSIPLSPLGARGQAGTSLAIIVSVCCFVMAGCWVLRWPTRRQSAAFAIVSTACIAIACFIDHDHQSALMGCVAFAMVSGYVALLHTARFMVLVVATASLTTLVVAAELVSDNPDLLLPAGRMTLAAVTMLAFPLIVQALMFYLVDDAHRSDVDPLSGLLNRRGFDRAAARLVTTRPPTDDHYLALAMLDLDNFKHLNDTCGHAVGDRALIAVGEALMHHTGATAIVARAGGEEFFVVDTYPTADVAAADRWRDAIARSPYGITASVGVATTPLPLPRPDRRLTLIDELIDTADAAMYEAKRAGGNQTRRRDHAGPSGG